MGIHKKVLLALFIISTLTIAAAFLLKCEDSLFIGGCGLAKFVTYVGTVVFFVSFSAISSLVYWIFLKKMSVLKWQTYAIIYALSLVLIALIFHFLIPFFIRFFVR